MFSYIYYCFYKVVSFTSPPEDFPQYSAAILCALLFYFNLVLIVDVLPPTFISDFYLNKVSIIIVMSLLLLIGYFSFVWQKKYLKIAERYDQESKNQKIVKMSLAWLYIIGSLILLVII